MQDWHIVGAKGKKQREQARRFDDRLTPTYDDTLYPTRAQPTVPLAVRPALSDQSAQREQQYLQSLERQRQAVQASSFFKAVQAAFQIAEADSGSEDGDRGARRPWLLQHIQQLVVWGLGSLTSGQHT